jgi:hypothetical protein
VTTIDHAKKLASLLKTLKGAYDPEPAEPRTPMEEFVMSFLMWEATRAKAELAIKRVLSGIVDINELRVCRPADIVAMLGKQYPLVEERAQRMKAALHEIFLREYAVSLDKPIAMNKRDGRKYIETLEGMTPYVAARVTLVCLGGHAVPLDRKLLAQLVEAGVLEPDTDETKAQGILERHIMANESSECHALLQAWSDDVATGGGGARKKGARPARTTTASATAAAPAKKNKTGAVRKKAGKAG